MVDTMGEKNANDNQSLRFIWRPSASPLLRAGKFDDTDGSLKSFPFRLPALL